MGLSRTSRAHWSTTRGCVVKHRRVYHIALFSTTARCDVSHSATLAALSPNCCKTCGSLSQAPKFTTKDLVLVVRDKVPEVWTLRAFAAGELVLLPLSNEIKDQSLCAVFTV